jgi:hypothetical protein
VKKKSPLSAFLSLLLLSTLLVTFLAVPAHAAPSWNVQIVDEDASGIGYGFCPIAVDSNNNPHIAYSGSPEARYASWNGSGWNIQQIPSYAFVHDLVLDANGDPHITLGSLAYGTWNGSGWDFQTVTTDYTVYSSLALDSSGNPHVAYITGDKLKYATQNGSNWTIQTVAVDKLQQDSIRLSLALNSHDTPYIMYRTRPYVDNSTGEEHSSVDIKLAVWQNSRWNIETVRTSSHLVTFGNMVLDSKGNPHFLGKQYLYPEGSDTRVETIEYVSWDGWAWNTQTVTSNVSLTNLGLLALDSNDHPNIVYITGPPEQLVYARWTGAAWGWESHTVVGYDLASQPAFDIAVDSNGNPHISYLKIGKIESTSRILYLMYATANVTEPAGSPAFPALPLLLASTAVIIGAVVTVVYVWKKKTQTLTNACSLSPSTLTTNEKSTM